MENIFDLVILGGGSGGYVAAIRATQLGLKTAIIEKNLLGGTCLHKGCIPTKSILRSAELYATLKSKDEFGIIAENISFDFLKIQERKQKIVEQLTKGIEFLMKKNKITVFSGYGKFISENTISVEIENGVIENIMGKNFIIATGSLPKLLPNMKVDGEYIMTSDDALEMSELPKSIIIIGGGVIGIEWASLLNDFGVDVTIIEYEDSLLPLEDREISKELMRIFKKRKIKFYTKTKVNSETITIKNNNVSLQAEKDGEIIDFTAEKVLVSVGRIGNIKNIGLENINVSVEKGYLKVNEFMQTNVKNIYAVGDVIGGLQLAHVASHEGIIAVETIAEKNPKPLDYSTVAKCTYSRPEVANVGISEEEAKRAGYAIKVGKFNFRAIGKALIVGEVDGFVKIIVEEKTNKLLGVHMIGPHVTDLITEASLAKVLEITNWEIAHTIHPHPTLTEIMGEAALNVDNLAIHM